MYQYCFGKIVCLIKVKWIVSQCSKQILIRFKLVFIMNEISKSVTLTEFEHTFVNIFYQTVFFFANSIKK